MKKVLLSLIVISMFTSAIFAEVTVGAWGRGLFVPYAQSGDDDATTDNATSWGGNPRVGFTVSGNSDNVGFQADINVDTEDLGYVTLGDQQKIWVKPMEGVTLSSGVVYVDNLRGMAAFGGWDWIRSYGAVQESEDFTFDRARTDNLTDMVGFTAVYDANGITGVVVFRDVQGGLAEDLFSNGVYQLGYAIDGIGTVKAQTQLANDGTGFMQFAFDLNSVENMSLSVGTKLPTSTDYADAAQSYDAEIMAYANYTMDAMKFHLSAEAIMLDSDYKDSTSDADMPLSFGLGFDYDLGNSLGLTSDVRFQNGGYVNDDGSVDDSRVGLTAGVTKGYSNGLMGIAVQGYNDGTDTTYAIPVRFEYWF